MMTKIVVASLAAAAFIAGIALITSAPASNSSSTPRPHAARGVSVPMPVDSLTTMRETAARGAIRKEADTASAPDTRDRRPRGATVSN